MLREFQNIKKIGRLFTLSFLTRTRRGIIWLSVLGQKTQR